MDRQHTPSAGPGTPFRGPRLAPERRLARARNVLFTTMAALCLVAAFLVMAAELASAPAHLVRSPVAQLARP